ncbi:hypothetical protein MRB53_040727 [Persea americana]|nr:hypothetical protein MRB53_040727 [Persea americana]
MIDEGGVKGGDEKDRRRGGGSGAVLLDVVVRRKVSTAVVEAVGREVNWGGDGVVVLHLTSPGSGAAAGVRVDPGRGSGCGAKRPEERHEGGGAGGGTLALDAATAESAASVAVLGCATSRILQTQVAQACADDDVGPGCIVDSSSKVSLAMGCICRATGPIRRTAMAWGWSSADGGLYNRVVCAYLVQIVAPMKLQSLLQLDFLDFTECTVGRVLQLETRAPPGRDARRRLRSLFPKCSAKFHPVHLQHRRGISSCSRSLAVPVANFT